MFIIPKHKSIIEICLVPNFGIFWSLYFKTMGYSLLNPTKLQFFDVSNAF